MKIIQVLNLKRKVTKKAQILKTFFNFYLQNKKRKNTNFLHISVKCLRNFSIYIYIYKQILYTTKKS